MTIITRDDHLKVIEQHRDPNSLTYNPSLAVEAASHLEEAERKFHYIDIIDIATVNPSTYILSRLAISFLEAGEFHFARKTAKELPNNGAFDRQIIKLERFNPDLDERAFAVKVIENCSPLSKFKLYQGVIKYDLSEGNYEGASSYALRKEYTASHELCKIIEHAIENERIDGAVTAAKKMPEEELYMLRNSVTEAIQKGQYEASIELTKILKCKYEKRALLDSIVEKCYEAGNYKVALDAALAIEPADERDAKLESIFEYDLLVHAFEELSKQNRAHFEEVVAQLV